LSFRAARVAVSRYGGRPWLFFGLCSLARGFVRGGFGFLLHLHIFGFGVFRRRTVGQGLRGALFPRVGGGAGLSAVGIGASFCFVRGCGGSLASSSAFAERPSQAGFSSSHFFGSFPWRRRQSRLYSILAITSAACIQLLPALEMMNASYFVGGGDARYAHGGVAASKVRSGVFCQLEDWRPELGVVEE